MSAAKAGGGMSDDNNGGTWKKRKLLDIPHLPPSTDEDINGDSDGKGDLDKELERKILKFYSERKFRTSMHSTSRLRDEDNDEEAATDEDTDVDSDGREGEDKGLERKSLQLVPHPTERKFRTLMHPMSPDTDEDNTDEDTDGGTDEDTDEDSDGGEGEDKGSKTFLLSQLVPHPMERKFRPKNDIINVSTDDDRDEDSTGDDTDGKEDEDKGLRGRNLKPPFYYLVKEPYLTLRRFEKMLPEEDGVNEGGGDGKNDSNNGGIEKKRASVDPYSLPSTDTDTDDEDEETAIVLIHEENADDEDTDADTYEDTDEDTDRKEDEDNDLNRRKMNLYLVQVPQRKLRSKNPMYSPADSMFVKGKVPDHLKVMRNFRSLNLMSLEDIIDDDSTDEDTDGKESEGKGKAKEPALPLGYLKVRKYPSAKVRPVSWPNPYRFRKPSSRPAAADRRNVNEKGSNEQNQNGKGMWSWGR